MNPYIGITDFMNFQQVQSMFKVFAGHLKQESKRKLHVGVMMSYKTLHDIPSKWQNAFPLKETIADIFSSDDVYNCLHYVDHNDDPELWRSLVKAISFGGIGIHAIQLDMTWPDPGQIAQGIHTSRTHIEVILQIGNYALKQIDNNPKILVERLKDYENVVHRVLLDKSMGQGIDMDTTAFLPFAQAIKENFPLFGIVVAGGLGPETIQLIEPLIQEFPALSIDAQGRLRPSNNALDPIDWSIAKDYLIKALQTLA